MFELNPNTPSEMITAVAVAVEAIAYMAFYHLGASMNNKRTGQWNIGPRGLACIATVVAAAWMIRYAQAHLVDTAAYAAMSAREQGEYLGRVLRSIVIPAIVIIGLSASKAWRDKQERNARARAAANTSK